MQSEVLKTFDNSCWVQNKWRDKPLLLFCSYVYYYNTGVGRKLLCGFEIVDRVSQEFKPTKILLREMHGISIRYTGVQYCSGHKIEKNELGGACSTYE